MTIVIALALVPVSPASPASGLTSPTFESCLLDRINSSRLSEGTHALRMSSDLNDLVRRWSEWMRHNEFEHMATSLRDQILPDGTKIWAENIAWSSDTTMTDCSAIHTLLMESPHHRANILGPSYRFAALGAYHDETGWWVTEVFFDAIPCRGTFCDDDSSPFETEIEKVAAAGISKGCAPNRFCPDDPVTRGQMAAFLTRALDLPHTTGFGFIDDDGSVFEADIEALAAAGISKGCAPNRFCPDDPVTRGQMAAFLTRALDL